MLRKSTRVRLDWIAQGRNAHTGAMTSHNWAWRARDVVRVHGVDAASYLQGQVTQNVQVLANGDAAWSFLLQPTGKVVGWFRISRMDSDDFAIDTEPGAGTPILDRLARFRLRMKLELTLTKGQCAPFDAHDGALGDDAIVTLRSWPAHGGLDVLRLSEPAESSLVEADEWQRIAAGIPRAGIDFPLDDSMIPAEFGSGILNASVDFNKGCYTGQELVHRMNARGNNAPRPLRVLVMAAAETVGPDASVFLDGTEVGTVSSIATDPNDHTIAFARLSRRVAVGADVLVAKSASAQVHDLPQTGYDHRS